MLAGAAAQDPASGWMAYAVGTVPAGTERITRLEMTWTVGQDPPRSFSFFSPWFGMDPADNLNLVQPVNPWGGSSWSMYTEYFQWSPTHNSNSRQEPVKAGQTLHGSIVYSAADDSYTLTQKVVETGATSSQVVKCQSGKKYMLPYVVYEKLASCKNYPPDGVVTFRDIIVECDGKDCTSGVKWEAKVKDPNCNMKAVIKDPKTISITWDTAAASKYDNYTDDQLFDINYRGWAARLPLMRPSAAALAAKVNKEAAWTAGHNVLPAPFQTLLGSKVAPSAFPEVQLAPGFKAPASFDARQQWGAKCGVIGTVRNQASCGSCWAFGSTEAFEDRRCIATGADVEMSAEDTAACCSGFACGLSMGCNGGQPGAALSWMSRTGVVTGGDYFDIGSGGSCLPYSLKPCAHHVPATSKYAKCPSSEYPTPKCSKQCSESAYSKSYSADKNKASRAYSLSGETAIMTSIMQKGPVSAAFTVYGDFPTYKSGVYKHTTGSALGGHAVEIVGWGVDNGQKYWLVKNSWNDQWGDGGFFKIARGNDECGIESNINGVDF
eukprot:TRINITY_DN1647_c0_g1_i6.p1 TRINITY_DN1647_c0_g1~~TRINITY_DN1647_c0_g1_i6.p1  ORF type:complete len:591 (+),score=265.75 TRINITY_DN1647_c0_g1_i6:124-1773(+)